MRLIVAFAPLALLACLQGNSVDLVPGRTGQLALSFESVPASGVEGRELAPVTVRVVDRDGVLVLAPAIEVSLSAQRDGDPTIYHFSDGVSDRGKLIFDHVTMPVEGTVRLLASSSSADPATSDPIVVSAAVNRLFFRTEPSNTVIGEAIVPAVEVELQDMYGLLTPADGVNIELEWLRDGVPTNDLSARAETIAGVARFEQLRGMVAGGGYALSASSFGLPVRRSDMFSLLPLPGTMLSWVVPPFRSEVRGEAMHDFSVELIDRTGERSLGDAEVTAEAIDGSGQLRGRTTVRAIEGIVTFTGLSYPVAEQIRIRCTSANTGELISEPIYVRDPPDTPIRAGFEPGVEPFSAYNGSLSFNGRRLVFSCHGCVTASGESVSSPWLIDFELGTNQAFNTTPSGDPIDNYDDFPYLTRDGTKMVFSSASTNYVANDVSGYIPDAYARDLSSGAVEMTGVDPLGAQFVRGSYVSAGGVSDDGNLVAMHADAPVPARNGARNAIYLRDRAAGTTRMAVEVGWSHTTYNTTAALSSDGSLLLFDAPADGLTLDDNNNRSDVFIADLANGSIIRISTPIPELPGDGHSNWAQFSGDGRFVTFQSDAKNLVPGDTNDVTDIFVADVLFGTIERVSVSSTGVEASATMSVASNFVFSGSLMPAISDDGRFIVFLSAADNLVEGDTNQVGDAFVHDRLTAQTVRINLSADGLQGNESAREVTISGDGSTIAFATEASNVVRGDTNNNPDLFIVGNPLD